MDDSNGTPIIGEDLAKKVANKLKSKDLCYVHRDYCGMGLFHNGGSFQYSSVFDGYQADVSMSFSDEDKFINWLSQQTDASLDGSDEQSFYRNNQRITIERLEGFCSLE